MKTLKKFVALMTLAALVAGPAQALAQTTETTVTTGMTFTAGGGTAPVVEAKWEMDAPYTDYLGTDDSVAPGAQFNAPGVWGQTMNYSICAIVSDANGADSVNEVAARIYYPDNRPMHTYTYVNGVYTQTEDPDNPSIGCGSFIEKNILVKITDPTVAYNLFCNTIKNNNPNLPTWASKYADATAMYNAICGEEGMLKKDTARVYCDNKYLIWEDPAGEYSVDVTAVDNGGMTSAALNNHFTYLENQGFEVDFSSVAYGEVLYNTHKVIPGDRTWLPSSSDRPTVRNTGNTRLQLGVAQDDMGLAKNAGLNHVEFDARVGSGATYAVYYPFKYVTDTTTQPTQSNYAWLNEILDLSEVEEMDFSIKLLNTPFDGAKSYSGNMWIAAQRAEFGTCPTPPTSG